MIIYEYKEGEQKITFLGYLLPHDPVVILPKNLDPPPMEVNNKTSMTSNKKLYKKG